MMARFEFNDPRRVIADLNEIVPGSESGFVHDLDGDCVCGAHHIRTEITRYDMGSLHLLHPTPDMDYTVVCVGEVSTRTTYDDWGRPLPKGVRVFVVEDVVSIDSKRPAHWIEPDPPRPNIAIDSIHWPDDNPSQVVLTYWGVPRDDQDPNLRVTGPWAPHRTTYDVDPDYFDARWLVCLHQHFRTYVVPFISLDIARRFCEDGADAGEFSPEAIVERTAEPVPWNRWSFEPTEGTEDG